MIQAEQKTRMLNKLNINSTIDFKELLGITDAFQIVSGQSYAIGNTKGLLEYLKEGNTITILNFDRSTQKKVLSSVKDLANILNGIDQNIDLCNDSEFKAYFK